MKKPKPTKRIRRAHRVTGSKRTQPQEGRLWSWFQFAAFLDRHGYDE